MSKVCHGTTYFYLHLFRSIVPTLQGYEDSGQFTFNERLKTSIHANMIYYATIGSIGLFGLVLLIIMRHDWVRGILGFSMACSNTFGLVTGAFLLGFGLSEIPRNIWRNADGTHRQQILSHRVAKMAMKLDHAHQEYCNVIFVVQATSNQMSKRDPLRPCMVIIDNMLARMLREDPLFKPSGGKLGENDMDYDTDSKTMAALRRQLRRAHKKYYRRKRVHLALFTEKTAYESTFYYPWVHLSFHTVAEATLLPSDVDLSLFSNLINVVGKKEVLVQVVAFIPLMYMCICTYYSLLRIGMMVFYSLTPGQTSSVSLLMICNFFGHLIDFFGSLKRFKYWTDQEDMDGFDPSGVIILQKERTLMEQGHKVSEHVTPLARNFSSVSKDVESGNVSMGKETAEMKTERTAHEHSSIREQCSSQKPVEQMQKGTSSTSISLEAGNSEKPSSVSVAVAPDSSAGTPSTWTSMKTGLQKFKTNMSSKKFLRLGQSAPTPVSLDEIFQRQTESEQCRCGSP